VSPPPRIYRVVYRSAHGRRRVLRLIVKVPYGGLFNLSEVLARAAYTGEVLWYRIEVANNITRDERDGLTRWPVALQASSAASGVNWNT
jgi:hypothetical protein